MSATMTMTAEQRELMSRFVSEQNGGDELDYVDEDFAVTRDEFDQFDGSHWAEADGQLDDPDHGVPARYFSRVQTSAGEPRVQLWVMDFGDFRVCYTI